MKSNIDYTLYLVTDRSILQGRNLLESVEEAIKGGVTLVQLREKSLSTKEFYNVAVELKKLTDRYNIPLIINDRLDIALSINASGLHIGQDDLPTSVARKLLGKDKILGVSARNLEEALKASSEGADYIGVGAMFPTISKSDAVWVSIEQLKEIRENTSLPIVAIGGITEKNVKELTHCNIDGISVISDILGKKDIKMAAERIKLNFLNKI